MPEAYVVGQITVKNPEKWDEYRSRVPQTLEPWGAELVFRGALEGMYAGETTHPDCWRRFKIEPPCRLNFEPGLMANL